MPNSYVDKLTEADTIQLKNNFKIEELGVDAIKIPIDLGGKMIKIYDTDKTKRDNALLGLCNIHLNHIKQNQKEINVEVYDQVILIPESNIFSIFAKINLITNRHGFSINRV